MTIAVGADIGGSHISAAAIDMTSGAILEGTAAERAIDNQAPAEEILAAWAACIGESLARVPAAQVKGIGIAMPGPFDYVDGIGYFKGVAKYESLHGRNVGEALRAALKSEIRFMNDASCFAVGEARAGKAVGTRRSMSITLGTGLGSAVVEDGIPLVDGPRVPPLGCLGHLPFGNGIADEHFSTRWFVRRYLEETGTKIHGVKDLTISKDPAAQALFDTFGSELAGFVSPWLRRLEAEVLVIGGNISFAWDHFGSAFEARLAKEGYPCRVERSELKEEAALLGAACLVDDGFWKSVQHALPLMSQKTE